MGLGVEIGMQTDCFSSLPKKRKKVVIILRTTYKLTNQTKEVNGMTLHLIRALPGNKFAVVGTYGGWIEREENLSDGA